MLQVQDLSHKSSDTRFLYDIPLGQVFKGTIVEGRDRTNGVYLKGYTGAMLLESPYIWFNSAVEVENYTPVDAKLVLT